MEDQLSWKKAYGISFLIHILLVLALAISLRCVITETEKQTYEIDLQASNFSQGSGHAGGGGSSAAFPEPIKSAEMAKRVETVQAQVAEPNPAPALPTPDAIPLPSTSSTSAASNEATAASTGAHEGDGSGGGTGSGEGTGSGDSKGDGQGYGDGTGSGQGSGNGNISGTGAVPFDVDGFWRAVDANKSYPIMAVKRHLEGNVTILTTIDSAGNIVNVQLIGSSGQGMLDNAAVAAARAVGYYPNPTGKDITIETTVNFSLE